MRYGSDVTSHPGLNDDASRAVSVATLSVFFFLVRGAQLLELTPLG